MSNFQPATKAQKNMFLGANVYRVEPSAVQPPWMYSINVIEEEGKRSTRQHYTFYFMALLYIDIYLKKKKKKSLMSAECFFMKLG